MDIKITELAQIVGMHPVTLRRLAREGKLPGAYRIGGSWRCNPEVIEQLRPKALSAPASKDEAAA